MAGITLDDLDLRILAILQDDASVSNNWPSGHSSPPTCMRRVRRLTEAGVIRRQVAVLDPVAIGTAVTALIEISLDRQTAEDYAFEAYVCAEPAVTQCYRVSPGPDFVVVADLADVAEYDEFARRLFTGIERPQRADVLLDASREVRSERSGHARDAQAREVIAPSFAMRSRMPARRHHVITQPHHPRPPVAAACRTRSNAEAGNTLPHVVRVLTNRLAHHRIRIGITLHEARRVRIERADHVLGHEHLPVARGRCADADRRDRQRFGDMARSALRPSLR